MVRFYSFPAEVSMDRDKQKVHLGRGESFESYRI